MTLIAPDMPSFKTTTKEGDHDFRESFEMAFNFGNLGKFSHLQSENMKTNVYNHQNGCDGISIHRAFTSPQTAL